LFKKSNTVKCEVSRQGSGLFSGLPVRITFAPAPLGCGIIFQRVDLPGSPTIEANISSVKATPRCTILGIGDTYVQTVEHVLAALTACGVDNLLIKIDAPEVPIFDGSSLTFIDMIDEAGLCELSMDTPAYKVSRPLFWASDDMQIVALPSEVYKISYTMHYPQSKFLGSQFYSLEVTEEAFKRDIAPCRTFSIYEEILPYIEKGFLKGGSLENAVIIKEDKVMNPDGLRFPDEMARHKVLDLIGDLSLVGVPFIAHIIAVRSGHFANNAFAKELLNHIKMEIS
jgi:UDP-3-O-[3-hydroxymyristoyl] N-acetylglucosamine deacetylase